MKKIKFNSLYIKNFRNINELKIDFNEKTTYIMSVNGKGKTNALSSIMWCLFGKDIYDTKQFVISPIINGKEDNSLTTIVKMVINDNYVIERTYKDRKTSLKTGWIIDGEENLVAITQTKYNQELLDNLVDEETFKSLSNVNYIPNLHWKDLKALIFELIGNITDEEVLLRDDFKLIEEYVTKFGIEQTQELVKETEKKVNEDIKRLETEYQTLVNTKEKYVVEESESQSLNTRKQEIENILFQNQKENEKLNEQREHYRKAEEKIRHKESEIKIFENEIEMANKNIKEYEELYNQAGTSVEDLKAKDVKQLMEEINSLGEEKKKINLNIEKVNENLKAFKEQGEKLKNQEIKIENSKCSACGQELPESKLKETLEKLKEQQIEELTKVKNAYDKEKDLLVEWENDLKLCEERLHDRNIKLENIDKKEYQVEEETDRQKRIRIAKEEKELELKDFISKKETLEKELDLLKEQFEYMEYPEQVENDLFPLKLELDDINEKLATSITLTKINEDIDNTYKELELKRNNKNLNKDKMQEIIKFNNIKADLLKEKVRKYFDIVNFKTKEYTQSGEEVETFKICNEKGVEWKETNSANKILLGIDLIQGIQKAKDLEIPILIDNTEQITSEIETKGCQLIMAKATKEYDKLTIK